MNIRRRSMSNNYFSLLVSNLSPLVVFVIAALVLRRPNIITKSKVLRIPIQLVGILLFLDEWIISGTGIAIIANSKHVASAIFSYEGTTTILHIIYAICFSAFLLLPTKHNGFLKWIDSKITNKKRGDEV